MTPKGTGLAGWSAGEIEAGRRWVASWRSAGEAMECLRRRELRRIDSRRSIALLCGEANYRLPPRVCRPTSGLVDQQRWFKKAALHD